MKQERIIGLVSLLLQTSSNQEDPRNNIAEKNWVVVIIEHKIVRNNNLLNW